MLGSPKWKSQFEKLAVIPFPCGALMLCLLIAGSLDAQTTGPLLLQGTQRVVVTAGGCTSTATLTAQYFSAYPGLINTWSDVLGIGESNGSLTGSLAYNIPCKSLSSAGISITGAWSYNELQGFTIEWILPSDLTYLTVAGSFSSLYPPIFSISQVNATASGITGSYVDSTSNITLNLSANGGPGPTGSSAPAITSLSPPSAAAGGPAFTLRVNGTNFASGATVQWNGNALPTMFVSSTQLVASVAASLIASAGTASITVLSGGQGSTAASFTISPASGAGIAFSNQVVTGQARTSTGCVRPPSATSFLTTNNTVYLYFEATVTTSDLLSSNWLAPDGTVVPGSNWNSISGNYCYNSSLSIGNLPASRLGSWQVRVYDNGNPLFSISFTVNAPPTASGPAITFSNQDVTGQAPASAGCVRPPSATAFLTTNNTVYLYFEAIVTTSDLLSSNWLAPDGTVVPGFNWNAASGNYCYTSNLNIGNLPASLLGSWQVRVYDNGNPLFSISFTVNAPPAASGPGIAFSNQDVTGQAPASTGCVRPPSATAFLTTNNTVYLYFEATVTTSDLLSNNWLAPDGTVVPGGSWTSASGNYCYSSSLSIGNLPASRLGSWQVHVYDNGNPLFSISFTISAPQTTSGATSASVYSTGQNVTNGRDSSYQVVRDTTGQLVAPAPAFVVTSLAGGWATIPRAAWIAPSADQSNATRNPCCANTADTYRTVFTVSGNPSSVALSLTVAADDYVDVLLNGAPVFTHPNTAMYGTPVAFSIKSGFVSGTNTLDFLVTNGGGPTGLIVAIASAASGQTQFIPGQLLTLNGSFNTAASVTTTVAFADNAGYQLSVIPLSVTSGSVSVLVPPYLNMAQANITSGSVTASVIQQPSTGQKTSTSPVSLQIAALPQTGVSPGRITLDVLTQLSQLAGTANQTWSTIAKQSGGMVDISQLNIPALQSGLGVAQADVQSLISGTVTQIGLGQLGGKSVYLDINGLALMDQVFFAYYLGSMAPPAQVQSALRRRTAFQPRQAGDDPVTDFHNWFAGLVTSTLPQNIASNALRLRGITSAAIGLVVLIAAPAEVALAASAAVAGFVWLAVTWASAATTATLEGAGSEILNEHPPDIRDFPNTLGIIGNAYNDVGTGELFGVIAETGGQAGRTLETIVQTVGNIQAAVDPGNPNGVTAETMTAAGQNLFNTANPFSGSWTGTYNRTPADGCPSYSGQLLNVTLTQSSDGSVDGNVVITGVPIYDANCNVTEIENDGSVGGMDGKSSGADSNGDATIRGIMSDIYNDLNFTGFWNYTATLSNGTINGQFFGGGSSGSFTLHH